MRDQRPESVDVPHCKNERNKECLARTACETMVKAGPKDKALNKKRSRVLHFDVRVSNVVGMNGAEALQRRGGERDAG